MHTLVVVQSIGASASSKQASPRAPSCRAHLLIFSTFRPGNPTKMASPPSPPPDPSTLIPNVTRIRDASSFLGTVRYVGPVASAKNRDEIYVGVEWDDPTRGKHDGSVICRRTNTIVRHFRCSNRPHRTFSLIVGGASGAGVGSGGYSGSGGSNGRPNGTTSTVDRTAVDHTTSASYLRLTTYPHDWDTGQPLTTALLQTRYVPPNAPQIAPTNILPHYALTSSGKEKPIEFWGELKIRARQQPEMMVGVSLRGMGISSPPPSIESVCEFSHLREMDLAGNLLCRWYDVLKILRCFPKLEKVGLAGNRLGSVERCGGVVDAGAGAGACGTDCGASGAASEISDIADTADTAATDIAEVAAAKSDDVIATKTGDGNEFPNIKILNLNGTSITSFRTVAWVGRIMPNLEELCLAHCDLSDMDAFDAATAETSGASSGASSGDTETNGTNAEINAGADANANATTGIYDDIAKMSLQDDAAATCTPSPTEIHPPSPISGLFDHLRLLDLSDCNLSSWSEQIGRLGSLPRLADLVLNDNPIGTISQSMVSTQIDDDDDGGDNDEVGATTYEHFPSLTTLQLTNADITSWSSIDALNTILPNTNLKSLRFRNNPITSNISAAEARSVTIARLPSLEYLNASPVGEKERLESERRYVSTVVRELLMAETAAAATAAAAAAHALSTTTTVNGANGNSGSAEEDKEKQAQEEVAKQRSIILSQHPRFEELTAKHGDAMAAARASAGGPKAGGGGGSLSHDAINVTIRSMAASSCGTEPLTRRLPGSLAVGRVKLMCARAFGLDVDLQALHFRASGGDDPFPTELDDDDNTLSYYGVSDGAEILMNEIDVEARKREEERERTLQEQRIEEQERTATALQAAQTKGFEVKA